MKKTNVYRLVCCLVMVGMILAYIFLYTFFVVGQLAMAPMVTFLFSNIVFNFLPFFGGAGALCALCFLGGCMFFRSLRRWEAKANPQYDEITIPLQSHSTVVTQQTRANVMKIRQALAMAVSPDQFSCACEQYWCTMDADDSEKQARFFAELNPRHQAFNVYMEAAEKGFAFFFQLVKMTYTHVRDPALRMELGQAVPYILFLAFSIFYQENQKDVKLWSVLCTHIYTAFRGHVLQFQYEGQYIEGFILNNVAEEADDYLDALKAAFHITCFPWDEEEAPPKEIARNSTSLSSICNLGKSSSSLCALFNTSQQALVFDESQSVIVLKSGGNNLGL